MTKSRTLIEDAQMVPNGCRWSFEGSNEEMMKYNGRVVYDGSMLWVSEKQQQRTDFRRLNIQYGIDEFIDKLELFVAHRWPRSLQLVAAIREKKDKDPDYREVLEKWCSGAPDASTVELRDVICAPFQHHECVTSQISDTPGYGYHSLAYFNIWVALDTCGMFARNAFVHPLGKHIDDAQIVGAELTYAFLGKESQRFYETNFEGYSQCETSARKVGSADVVAAIVEMPDHSRSYMMTANGRTFVGMDLQSDYFMSTADFLASEHKILISDAFKSAQSGPGSRIEIDLHRPNQGFRSGLDGIIKEQAAYYGLSIEEHGRVVEELADVQENTELGL
ncbi:hypothetical protein SAMN02744133_10818 [Thalassospira xiamenensis M-5 = DSM 17429]|uniref:FRG domain-containing protein n=1 Tax=Thalassospira xiamenensis M-5 = DSM 17429 TaxID=1123366 RepID=A0AB72UJ36_9PROT|nr:hypothetical protein [Thalassospira xiamenensis]AJD54298.1 hypothetical protein TH3_21128 [Thalassospira xiamenensis M-5 = DSM 17429]SIT20928.1 hypothetical protein SAMN02744133_10818 [Thalassospira xiamenensis M-5 = DSM 17429]